MRKHGNIEIFEDVDLRHRVFPAGTAWIVLFALAVVVTVFIVNQF